MANWGPIRFPDYSISQFAQPKQKFSFIALYQLPPGMNSVSTQGIKGEGSIGKSLSRTQNPQESILTKTDNLSDLLTISTKSFPDVSWQISVNTDSHFFNSKIHWSGKRIYTDSITIPFREYVTSPITRLFKNWQKLANDPVTNNIGYQNKYKGLIIKLEVDPNVFFDNNTEMLDIEKLLEKIKTDTQTGFNTNDLPNIITRQVIFDGVWPTTISEPGNDYNDQGSLQDCSVTFHCDRYFEDKDWARYMNNPAKTADSLQQAQ